MRDSLADSYYAATANRQRQRTRLAGDVSCDVAIIGGGFTGVAAALACAEKGFSVVLLEAETIGFGASGRNGGMCNNGFAQDFYGMSVTLGPERATMLYRVLYGWSIQRSRFTPQGRVALRQSDRKSVV